MPKLIILNGPLGIGKSTLAKRYAEEHSLTLNLDIDNIWAMLSDWRQEKDTSAPIAKDMAVEMARINLQAGNDVVVPQILQTAEIADRFQNLAHECNASYYEILLYAEKADAIKRFIKRGQSQGHPSGFRPGGIIDTSGREEKLSAIHDNMMQVASTRPHVIHINPIYDDIDGAYSELLNNLL